MKTIILKVSADKYELPIDLYASTHEMSVKTGMSLCDCDIALQRHSKNRKENCRFVRVKLSEKDDEREV